MKLKIILMMAMVVIGMTTGAADAKTCIDACHTQPPADSHCMVNTITCLDCHDTTNSPSCPQVLLGKKKTSSSSSGINVFNEVVDMDAIKSSSLDTWEKINDNEDGGVGLGTFLLGAVLLIAIVSVIAVYVLGAAIGPLGSITQTEKASVVGGNMTGSAVKYAIVLIVGLIALALIFSFL